MANWLVKRCNEEFVCKSLVKISDFHTLDDDDAIINIIKFLFE